MLVWTSVSKRYMDLSTRQILERVYEAVSPTLIDLLKPLAQRGKVVILRLPYRYNFGK